MSWHFLQMMTMLEISMIEGLEVGVSWCLTMKLFHGLVGNNFALHDLSQNLNT
jgi:hypothetical protein